MQTVFSAPHDTSTETDEQTYRVRQMIRCSLIPTKRLHPLFRPIHIAYLGVALAAALGWAALRFLT